MLKRVVELVTDAREGGRLQDIHSERGGGEEVWLEVRRKGQRFPRSCPCVYQELLETGEVLTCDPWAVELVRQGGRIGTVIIACDKTHRN